MKLSNKSKDRILRTLDFIFDRLPQTRPTAEQLRHVKFVAHRGCHSPERKENTLAAFAQAVQMGIDAIECDLRWTKDDVIVIHHDPDAKRIFSVDCEIENTEFRALREKCPEIPTLQELLELCKGRVHLFLEIKNRTEGFTSRHVSTLQESLQGFNPGTDFHLMTISFAPLSAFTWAPPTAWMTVAEMNLQSCSDITCERGLGGITSHYALMTKACIERHRQKGQFSGTGFIGSRDMLFRECKRNVDWLFTNHAENLVHWRAAALEEIANRA